MIKDAALSSCGNYRYTLTRVWDESLPVVAFIGLNPSTADAFDDDPTIRKCLKFAQRWGYGSLLMLNLYAWRATKPIELHRAREAGKDIIGYGGNDLADIVKSLFRYKVSLVVVAWGRNAPTERGDLLLALLRETNLTVSCFKKNGDGTPVHPLYQRDDSVLVTA